jgi:hypothetical protein
VRASSLPPLASLLLAASLGLACSSGDAGVPGPQADRAFLATVEGEWVGILQESAALDPRVIRESPMRLIVRASEPARVEYPTLRCRGELQQAPEGTPQTQGDVGRFQLEVDAAGLSPCLSGPLRITRKDDGLEYVFLGDSLRQVRAVLLPQP